MDVAAGSYYAGAGLEGVDDARELAAFGGGGQADDGAAAFATGGTTNEVYLTADAGVGCVTHGIGADLAAEVDFESGIDGADAGVAGDVEGVVGVVGLAEFKGWVVVDEIKEAAGAEDEAGDDFVWVDAFLGVVDDAFLD